MKRNKYNAARSGGFDSQLEKAYYERLCLLQKAGVLLEVKHHPAAVELMSFCPYCGRKSINWNVDFLCRTNEGEFYVETKGMEISEYKRKLKLWKQEISIPLLIVKGRKYRGEYCFRVTDSVNADDLPAEVK